MTKSGTAAAAEWKEAGRSPHAGRCGRSRSFASRAFRALAQDDRPGALYFKKKKERACHPDRPRREGSAFALAFRMDLVTFGEAMIRFSPPASRRLEQATSLEASVGGSELNVAVLAARLGVTSRWVSRLPDNALGRMIAARAREQGVDAHVDWTADGRVGLYFVEIGGARISSVLYDRAGS